MTDNASEPEQRASALRANIERTRAQLGETVAGLAYKADVKARMTDRAATLRQRAPGPAMSMGAVIGGILAVLGYLWWRNH